MPQLTLSITTRGIGINLCSFYAYLTVLLPEVKLPKIYASYRALLALLESRLMNFRYSSSGIECYTDFSPKVREYDNIIDIPIIFKRLLEAIKILEYKDIAYIPAMAKNTIIEGKFIPRPENIILSNLQQTVMALSGASDVTHRKIFYKNNPIPGAIWNDNYELMNAHEIIPPGYDIENELFNDMFALKSLSTHLGEYSKKIINNKHQNYAKLKKTEGFSSFICNEMGDLRVPDRKLEDRELDDYYCYCRPENDIDSVYSRYPLKNKKDKEEGTVFLLGEYPNDEGFVKPIYALRSEHVNSYFYHGYRYKTSYLRLNYV